MFDLFSNGRTYLFICLYTVIVYIYICSLYQIIQNVLENMLEKCAIACITCCMIVTVCLIIYKI